MSNSYLRFTANVNAAPCVTTQSRKNANWDKVLGMSADARQRRAALLAFMTAHNLNPWPWTQASEVANSALAGFLAGRSDTMTDKTYVKLASGASDLLGRRVSVAELHGEKPASQLEVRHAVDATGEVVALAQPFEWVEVPPHLIGGQAVMVRADTPASGWDAGDVLFAGSAVADVAPLLGHLALVQVKDGPMVVRKILKGSRRHRFHLIGVGATMLEDRAIASAAPIRWIRKAT